MPAFPAAFIIYVTAVADVMYIVSLLGNIDGLYALHQVRVMLLDTLCYLVLRHPLQHARYRSQ